MRGPVVVIVDDDADMLGSLESLVRTLRPEATVHAISDGARALAAMSRLRPDVVLTDLQMPYLGGRDLTALLQQTANRARIIVLSGSGPTALDEAARLGNVVSVLSKPPDVEALGRALAAALKD